VNDTVRIQVADWEWAVRETSRQIEESGRRVERAAYAALACVIAALILMLWRGWAPG
ncbi:MAG: hypothetical protein IT364_20375, partial [Candidatus Hydrogenedentes bacterium]|nr:hypothetical protein [Candidatus Hydrogenedentota bacterium]